MTKKYRDFSFNKRLFMKLQAVCKDAGLGRLYKGSKRKARKYYTTKRCINMLTWLSYNVGDIVHDCDGYNHEIESLPNVYPYRRKNFTAIAIEDQCLFTDGRLSCGCSAPTQATSAEDIRAFMKSFFEEYKDSDWLSKDPDSPDQQYLRGEEPNICDDSGFRSYIEKNIL